MFLTPWSKVLLGKLTVVQLVKKFPTFYESRAHYFVHKSPALVHILSQLNPVAHPPSLFLVHTFAVHSLGHVGPLYNKFPFFSINLYFVFMPSFTAHVNHSMHLPTISVWAFALMHFNVVKYGNFDSNLKNTLNVCHLMFVETTVVYSANHRHALD